MFLGVFLFTRNMKFLTKGRIHCISRSSLGTYLCFMRAHSLVELTKHDHSLRSHADLLCVRSIRMGSRSDRQ